MGRKERRSTISRNSEAIEVEYFLGDYVRKIDKPGKTACIWCNCEINYDSGGCKRLTQHAGAAKHKQVGCSSIL